MDRNQLPKAIDAIGDRLGLNYNVNRKKTAHQYVEDIKDSTRMEYEHVRNSVYSLDESKTVKTTKTKQTKLCKRKHPFKLSSKKLKALYKLKPQDKATIRYNTFEKVNLLWQQYAESVISDKTDMLGLFKMDFHGCLLEVEASRNPTLVAKKGIVVQETRNTFIVVTKTNAIVTIPKRECTFLFCISNTSYRVYGANLLYTTQTRTKLKYKRRQFFKNEI